MSGNATGHKRHAGTIKKRRVPLGPLGVALASLLVLVACLHRFASLEGRLAAAGLGKLPDSADNVQFGTGKWKSDLRFTFIRFNAEPNDIRHFITASHLSTNCCVAGLPDCPSWWPQKQPCWVTQACASSVPASTPGFPSHGGAAMVDHDEGYVYILLWRPLPFRRLRRHIPFI